MTHYILHTDVSVGEEGNVGIGYTLERVSEKISDCEIICKGKESRDTEHNRTDPEFINKCEHMAIDIAVSNTIEYYNDDDSSLTIKCDNDFVVRIINDKINRWDGFHADLRSNLKTLDWSIQHISRDFNHTADSLSREARASMLR